MDKREVLRNLSFGESVAEDEVDDLSRYFVETDPWNQLFDGAADIVYGAKGSGKSALYSLLNSKEDALFDRGIVVIAGEEPRGQPAFKATSAESPASEVEFVCLWKLYFLTLVDRVLDEYGVRARSGEARNLHQHLERAGLTHVAPAEGLSALIRTVHKYVKQLAGRIALEPGAVLPDGTSFTTRICFAELGDGDEGADTVNANELFQLAHVALEESGLEAWVLLDRLDVAFQDNAKLEEASLRALFRAYQDIKRWNHIRPKIFLRTDIWDRITHEGFREASHITRSVTIKWDESSLMNLVVRRLLDNPAVVQYAEAEPAQVLASASAQSSLFFALFPEMITKDRQRLNSLRWILSNLADGKNEVSPRDLIHLLKSARSIQIRELGVGRRAPAGQGLIGRTAFPEALKDVSQVRLKQTLFAEYPSLRPYIEALAGHSPDLTVAELERAWGRNTNLTRLVAGRLVDVGFFRKKRKTVVIRDYRTVRQPNVNHSCQEQWRRMPKGRYVELSDLAVLWDVSEREAAGLAQQLQKGGYVEGRKLAGPHLQVFSIPPLYWHAAEIGMTAS